MSEEREQRNQVFTGTAPPAGINPSTPMVSMADKLRQDFGMEVPVDIVPLPTGGKVYPQGSFLHGAETVEIKAMTAREEDILTSKAYLKKGTVITELIRSCLIEKSIDPADLLTGDRNTLMVAIRITGYTAEYEAEIQCPECEVKTKQPFNLSTLPIQRLEIEPVALGLNLFEFVLPLTKKNVRFKFLTGRDEEQMVATAEKMKKVGMPTDTAITTNLTYSIVSVDDIEDRAKINSFIRAIPARDSLALRNYIKDNEPGIQLKQEVTCPQCNHTEEVGMPIGVSFLWPGSGR